MGVTDFFKPIETVTVKDVQTILNTLKPGEYILIDVRQPKEYERSHLPGALLITLAELPDRLGELDPNKPTIAY
jgi:rhodanese-related sulfurtransferase